MLADKEKDRDKDKDKDRDRDRDSYRDLGVERERINNTYLTMLGFGMRYLSRKSILYKLILHRWILVFTAKRFLIVART